MPLISSILGPGQRAASTSIHPLRVLPAVVVVEDEEQMKDITDTLVLNGIFLPLPTDPVTVLYVKSLSRFC